MPTRPLKKNDTIEVRLPDTVKTAFAERCRRAGETPSAAIRGFIDGRLANRPARPASRWRLVVAMLAGSALGAGIAAPSFARSTPTDRSAFERLDRDHDRVLTYAEFRDR